MHKILLTGKNGQLGRELRRSLSSLCEVIALGRDDLDFLRPEKISSFLAEIPGLRLIVNTAAYTHVEMAEEEPLKAMTVNRDAPKVLAEVAEKNGIPITHYSTDYVFDGPKGNAYSEDDQIGPMNVYGKTKLEGELAVGETCEKHLILRTSWLYAIHGNNFFLKMLKLAKSKVVPRVVADQLGCPNYARMIADASSIIVQKILSGHEIPWGVYHLSGRGRTSWHGFASKIFELYNNSTGAALALPIPVSSDEYPTKATRPTNSVLCTKKLEQAFGIVLPSWEEQLGTAFQDWVELNSVRADTKTLEKSTTRRKS